MRIRKSSGSTSCQTQGENNEHHDDRQPAPGLDPDRSHGSKMAPGSRSAADDDHSGLHHGQPLWCAGGHGHTDHGLLLRGDGHPDDRRLPDGDRRHHQTAGHGEDQVQVARLLRDAHTRL